MAMLTMLAVTACSTIPEWTYWPRDESSSDETAERDDGRALRQQAMSHLNRGEAGTATRLLQERLEEAPGDERARNLLRQIEADPQDYLGRESFAYEVQPGESLTVLAQRFLGSHTEFFILARYNGLENPSRLRVGQTLRIPSEGGQEPAETAERVDRSIQVRQALEDEQHEQVLAIYEGIPPGELDAEDRELLGQTHRERITAALETGNTDQARAYLDQARNHATANGAWSDWINRLDARIKAESAWAQGQAAHENDPVAAAEAYREALNHNPEHQGAHDALSELRETVVPELHGEAIILYRNQSLGEAIRLWDQALSIAPDFDRARSYRSRAVELQERLESLDED